ncbi:hypothetical protein [Flavobacterium wongokense]|uniref:hypothetical protein n=1 Tax=Flavobacterium wongokense TaxID=2910674 RepID=UPI001F294E64|nr:hypothetical protein [Flavobacterium sp. WG47]MCF6130905.1 hypothetical protein [Flavobacterium sp. WG47]
MDKSKIHIYLLIVLVSFVTISFKNVDGYKYKAYKIPASKIRLTSFYVNDFDQVLAPIGGGIYLIKEKNWFLPPSKDYYFTSFATNLSDSSFFVFGNTPDASKLYYIKIEEKQPIQRYALAELDLGKYNIIYKSNIGYVWGVGKKKSKIGMVTDKGIKWIFEIEGVINQVQVNDKSEVFFSMGNTIYNIAKQKKVLALASKIYGFDFNDEGKLVVSYNEGIGIKDGDYIDIVATGAEGLVQFKNKKIYVLPQNGQFLYEFYQSI